MSFAMTYRFYFLRVTLTVYYSSSLTKMREVGDLFRNLIRFSIAGVRWMSPSASISMA
jgi:hypothetical protein